MSINMQNISSITQFIPELLQKTLYTYFEYFWHIWPHSTKIVVSFKKIVMFIAVKINFIPNFFFEILQSYCKLFTLSNLGRYCLAMPTKVNGIIL